MTDYKNAIVFIAGMKHCGKTYLAEKIAREAAEAGRRVIAISPQRDISIPGVPIARDRSFSWERLAGRSVVVYPDCDEMARDAIRFAWAVQEVPRRPLWLVIDEIQAHLSPAQPFADLKRLIWYGRHRQISLVGICQRPAQVHKDLVALADRKILFRIEEPNDLAYLRKWIGVDPERLRALPDRQYLAF